MSNPASQSHANLLCVLGFLLVACDSPGELDPVFDIGPIQIDSVDVELLESFPVRATARVTGVVGDGCSELLPIEQSRDGNELDISIRRRRPLDAVCPQIAHLFASRIPLEGTFAPGDYTLRVNDASVSFHVD
jgi:hypothetical protein